MDRTKEMHLDTSNSGHIGQEIRPEDSVSQTSRTSHLSARAEVLTLEDARREVELNERLAALHENQNLDRERSRAQMNSLLRAREMEFEKIRLEAELQETLAEIQRKEEQLQLETERKVVRAQTRITEELQSELGSRSRLSSIGPCDRTLGNDYPSLTPANESRFEPLQASVRPPTYSTPLENLPRIKSASQSDNSSAVLASALNTLADKLSNKQDRLPRMMPERFTGEYMEYPLWIKSFESLIEENAASISQRLYFLRKCTGGEAYEAIKGLLAMNTEEGYVKAKSVLQSRYGDEYIIARDCIQKIKAWTSIKAGDGKGLRQFSDFLNNTLTSLKASGHLKSLDTEDQVTILLAKLPRNIIDRWSRFVDKWLHELNNRGYPPFSELCKFLDREARIACNPFNAKHDLERHKAPAYKKDEGSKMKSLRSFATSVSGNANTRQCVICNEHHNTTQCSTLTKMNWDKRRDTLKKKGLCFGCLQEKHLIKTCKQRLSCEVCGGLHPTLLHREKRPETKAHGTRQGEDLQTENAQNALTLHTATGTFNQQEGGHYHSMIVPVYLRHKDAEKPIMTYALLDEQSNSSFISKKTLEELGIEGRKTKIKLATMLSSVIVDSQVVSGLSVVSAGPRSNGKAINLESVYLRESIPAHRGLIPRPETAQAYDHFKPIAGEFRPYMPDVEVGLLIGLDCPEAIKPQELIAVPGNSPWAMRTGLGWGIAGIIDQVKLTSVTNDEGCHVAFRTHAAEISPAAVLRMFDHDFNEVKKDEKVSLEDRKFMRIMENEIKRCPDGHYELPLPLKNEDLVLPNNKEIVTKRLMGLKKRLERDPRFKRDYCDFMEGMLEMGHAEPVPKGEPEGQVWYIPHHGVYHPRKPDKIRVVFDCSLDVNGNSLNKNLLQGPDQTNNLTGVLCRFRQESIAINCDIEGMFHQVRVNKRHRDLLRFLWWTNGDLSRPPTEYRMTVHLFGATSSPGCVNYALRHLADEYEEEYGVDVTNFVKHNFYADDGLKSVATESQAIELIHGTHALCKQGGFNLHKFVSSSKEVLAAVPVELRAKEAQRLNLDYDPLPIERTLGVEWVIESDCFQFRITLSDKPCTRRGILSVVSSVFDPLGLISPVIVVGKKILQDAIRDKCDWDDPVPEEIRTRWEKWRAQLPSLAKIQIPRCYKEKDFGKHDIVELHHFSDASLGGYGQCSYLRQVSQDGTVNCALVLGKSRVTPLKPVTIPRLELTAAVVSAKVSKFLDKELDYDRIQHYFWTDSKIVLGYIHNEARRFHIYVANRVQEIHDKTDVSRWNYVSTDCNPADLASRGAHVEELQTAKSWWNGPDFLQKSMPLEPDGQMERFQDLSTSDPEVRHTVAHTTKVTPEFSGLLDRLEYFSSWFRVKRAVSVCRKFLNLLKLKKAKRPRHCAKGRDVSALIRQNYVPVNVSELQEAEVVILREVQSHYFSKDIVVLQGLANMDKMSSKEGKMKLRQSSSLYRLDPFIGDDGLIHVGGRIKRANIPQELVHPIILPQRCHITRLIVNHHHQQACHAGRGITLNEVRSSGYWIIRARSAVMSCIKNCVRCRKYRGLTVQQKMADLPEDRLNATEPFRFSAVDYFGPFYVKEGRSMRKRWGVVFVCMASRAIHIESANCLDTDSFINAYRRFIARRGKVQQLRSDCGTNIVGARSEQQKMLNEMDQDKIRQALLKDSCDWIEFKMNVPQASHMGGSWERMIRSIRSVLTNLLDGHAEQLDDELLRTFLAEAEAIVNSRPITYQDTTPGEVREALSPNQLLTLKSCVVLPPPGVFQKEAVYCRKRWRRVQYLANQFWQRWKTEYLSSLQERQKWNKVHKNLQINDVVLVKDESTPRGQWPLGRVVKVYKSSDKLVRKVSVKIGQSVFDRPVQKLIYIYGSQDITEQ